MSEIASTFIWEVGNFQNLIKQIPKGRKIISQRFWLPQKSFDINNQQDLNRRTLWELSLFPNGVNGTKDVISLQISAIRTQFEKSNHITRRSKAICIGIGKYENCEHYESSKTLIKSLKLSPKSDVFNLTKNDGMEFPDFISLNSIFSEGDKSRAVSLFVQVTLLDNCDVDYSDDSLYEEYFEDERFADIEFVLDCGSKIKAHRIVLSANSTYFKNMLQGQWKEKSMEIIQIKETNYVAFRTVVYYIYSGKLYDIDGFDNFKQTFKLAEMMMLENLSKLIIDELSDLIDEENWYEYILLGWEFNNSFLKNIGLEYIADNWVKIKKSEGLLRLLASNNIEGIEELFYVVNRNMEIAKWNNCSLY
jgi:hypothetical protein